MMGSNFWRNALTKAFLSLQADVPTQNPFSLWSKANEAGFNILSRTATKISETLIWTNHKWNTTNRLLDILNIAFALTCV